MSLRTPSMRLGTALCCLVTLCLVAGVGAAQSPVAIEDSPTNETLGDVVELTVSVPENGTATVVVQQTDGSGYSRTVQVVDESGDGRVTLRINTFLGSRSANETAVYSVGDGDTVTVRGNAGSELSGTEYSVELYNGTATAGEPADTETIRLESPTAGRVSYATAPPNATDRLTTRRGLRRGRDAGWLRNSSTATAGETVVIGLHVDGIGGAVAASAGANDGERFLSMLDRPDVTLRIDGEPVPMRQDPRLPLNRTNVAGVVADRNNDSYYVVLDTGAARLTPASRDRVEDGDEFHPNLTVDGDARFDEYSDDTEPFEIAGREASFYTYGDRVAVPSGSTVTVAGRTNLLPGADLRVILSPNSVDEPIRRPVTVGPNGHFEATFDVSTDTLGRYGSVGVEHDGIAIEEAPIGAVGRETLVDPPETLPATAERVTVSVAALPAGGYVHVLGPGGERLGRSEYIRANRTRNVSMAIETDDIEGGTVLTVVASEDADVSGTDLDPGDTYHVGTLPLGQSIEIRAAASAPANDSQLPASTGTATGRATASSVTATTASGTTTAADGPGFGVVATLVAGLFALASGLARRR